MSKRVVIVSLYIFLLLPAIQVTAAEQVSSKQWQEITKDQAFSYSKKVEVVQQPPKANFFETVLGGIYAFFSSPWGKVIIWTLFFLLLGWALYKIFIGDKTGLFARKKEQLASSDVTTEEDLMTANWERQLKQAMTNNDMRLAVRYSYMWLLQLLQERDLIRYRNDKTNHEYYIELGSTQYGQSFRQLSQQYEYSWYGNYPLSTEAYDSYMDTFNIVKNLLGRK